MLIADRKSAFQMAHIRVTRQQCVQCCQIDQFQKLATLEVGGVIFYRFSGVLTWQYLLLRLHMPRVMGSKNLRLVDLYPTHG